MLLVVRAYLANDIDPGIVLFPSKDHIFVYNVQTSQHLDRCTYEYAFRDATHIYVEIRKLSCTPGSHALPESLAAADQYSTWKDRRVRPARVLYRWSIAWTGEACLRLELLIRRRPRRFSRMHHG